MTWRFSWLAMIVVEDRPAVHEKKKIRRAGGVSFAQQQAAAVSPAQNVARLAHIFGHERKLFLPRIL
jgi:hypothetical protein